jgi:hypothetical protein
MIGMQNWGFPRVMMHPDQVRQMMKQQPQKTPNPRGDRGVVLRSIWRREDHEFRRPEDFALLRKSLLYWDVVAWPQFLPPMDMSGEFNAVVKRMVASEETGDADLEFLRREQVLDLMPTAFLFASGQTDPPEESAWRYHESAFLNLEYHEPGQWAMAQSRTPFTSPAHAWSPNSDGALGSLTNLLPAPASGVTYRQIIEFRRANRELLVDFRMLLDELNLEIIANPRQAQIYSAAHRRLDATVADIWRSVHHQRFEAERITFGTAMAIGGWAATGAGIAASFMQHPFVAFPLALAAIGGGLYGGLQYRNEHMANPADKPGAAAYLLKAMDDEIIREPTST